MGLKTMQAYLNANHVFEGKKFLREDAYLAVVIVSDEQEQSDKDAKYYSEYLKSLKVNDGWAKVYSIVTKTPQQRWETEGTKYMSVSELTNGSVTDIKTDFHETLQKMGNTIVNLTKSFALGKKPYDASAIKVFVNNSENNDWSYDKELNAVVFSELLVPAAGSEIKVIFQVEQ
jgi:hypothetical protein